MDSIPRYPSSKLAIFAPGLNQSTQLPVLLYLSIMTCDVTTPQSQTGTMANVSDNSASSEEIDLHISFEVSSIEDSANEDVQDIMHYQFEPAGTDSDDSDESK